LMYKPKNDFSGNQRNSARSLSNSSF